MFGWDWDMNGDRDAFWRIVALLFALAGLADTAAGLPFHRRREMLGILCRGEAAVRPHFAGMALGPLSEEDAFYDDEPEPCRDAAILAGRFRALGFMLAGLLTLTDLFARPRGAIPQRGGNVSFRLACRQLTSPAPDTS